MRYKEIREAQLVRRVNRFVALVLLDGATVAVHVKNTGRCRELFTEGCRVYLAKSDNPKRKMSYDLVAVWKEREGAEPLLINVDSQAPNTAVEEWLLSGGDGLFEGYTVRREVFYQSSRFDFCLEKEGKRAYLEVKGVTLERDGVAAFPDAPTQRGVKHLWELVESLKENDAAYVLFVVQMAEIRALRPNDETHPAFGDALRRALAAGVKVLCYDCAVAPDSMCLRRPVEVWL